MRTNQLTFDNFPVQSEKKGARNNNSAAPFAFKERRKIDFYIPQVITIRPGSAVIFNDTSEIRRLKRHNGLNSGLFSPPKQNFGTGVMSRQVSARIKLALDYIGLVAKRKTVKVAGKNGAPGYSFKFDLNFFTLTLSDSQEKLKHTDEWIKQNMLKHCIDAMRARWPCFSYVWVAEPQENGNIHFHICTDHFICKNYLTKLWNEIQYKAGYLDNYLKKHGTKKAPSTKVEKGKGKDSIKRYMRKYFTKGKAVGKDGKPITVETVQAEIADLVGYIKKLKSEMRGGVPRFDEIRKAYGYLKTKRKRLEEMQRRKIRGRLWGCSENLSLKAYSTDFEGMIPFYNAEAVYSAGKIFEKDYFSVIVIDDFKDFVGRLSPDWRAEIRKYYSALFNPPIPEIIYQVGQNYRYSSVS